MKMADLNLPTLVTLAGAETERMQLERLAAQGFTGIRRSHGYLFQRLIDDEPTITALAAALGITQQGASKQVREVESLGYVERRGVAGDQRARTVRLTPRGRAGIESTRRIQADLQEQLIDRVGAAKVAAAKDVLAALLDIADAAEKVRTRGFPAPPEA
jgi:DNA-binding MarR family transcriptional regulator